MGSETPLKLPMIDFSTPGLKLGTPEWTSVKTQVQKALEEYGCFEALFEKIPLDLRKAVFGALKELFDLPLQTKLQNGSEKPYHGYLGQYPALPLYESMGIDDAPLPGKVKGLESGLGFRSRPRLARQGTTISACPAHDDQRGTPTVE